MYEGQFDDPLQVWKTVGCLNQLKSAERALKGVDVKGTEGPAGMQQFSGLPMMQSLHS
jgi:hypothetical protein